MAKKHVNRPMWHPALWPSWLLVFGLYLISRLPMATKWKAGDKLGRFLKKLLKGRAYVTRKNIQVCFPELTEAQQEQLVEDTFAACTQGFFETTHAWWGDCSPQLENLIITGEEHLREAQARGKGILMIGGHYAMLDMLVTLLAPQLAKPGYMYRPNDHPVIDRMIEGGRRRNNHIRGFTKRQSREMLSFLKQGGEVWYAADQDFGRRCEVFVPFFGVDTGCVTTPSWIIRESGATAICVAQFRHPNGQYELAFSPILEDFGLDERKDAETWNRHHENFIRQHPEQYLWLHKRFKTRPEGAKPIY